MDGIGRIHCIGIGGIGVSAVARGALALGVKVTGSDVRESQITSALRAEGAHVSIGHDAAHIQGADLVVYSTAVPDTNPELAAAREAGIPVEHRSRLLSRLLDAHERSIGVVGTHGKGTVSSCISWLLDAAGHNPGFLIGGLLENFPGLNARVTDRRLVVAEVDESDGSLLHVHPSIVILNNLEADHLNYYEDLAHIQRTVLQSLDENPRLERVIANVDSIGVREIIPNIKVPVTTFGQRENANVTARDVSLAALSAQFTLVVDGESLGTMTLNLPGAYNLDNALGALATCLSLDVPFSDLSSALPDFRGLENRFTLVEVGGRRIIKDYISHPTGIRRVLEAAAADGRRITAVFKPYRFTMIHYLQEDYADAFHNASETVITELYTAGEVPIPGIDTEYLCDKIRERGPKVTYIQEMEKIVAYLHDVVQDGEQVIFFGGDDLFRLADGYAETLRERT
jgi:UDP-N-acetylmuramate--alanine ligase